MPGPSSIDVDTAPITSLDLHDGNEALNPAADSLTTLEGTRLSDVPYLLAGVAVGLSFYGADHIRDAMSGVAERLAKTVGFALHNVQGG